MTCLHSDDGDDMTSLTCGFVLRVRVVARDAELEGVRHGLAGRVPRQRRRHYGSTTQPVSNTLHIATVHTTRALVTLQTILTPNQIENRLTYK